MIPVPGENNWSQNNRGDSLGTIQSSFNLDLSSNVGKVRTTRTKRVAYTGSPSTFGEVAGLEKFDGTLYALADSTSGDKIFTGGNSPFDAFTQDTTSLDDLSPGLADLKAWNNGLYAVTGQELFYSTNGSSWTEIGSNVLSVDSTHLLEALNAVLYVIDEDYKVKSVTSGNTFQGTGSQTLNLNIPGYSAQVLMAGIDSLWIGLSNVTGARPALVFEWDGQTENSPTARYEIDAAAIMAGVVKDGVPHIVDSQGRLLVFNGGIFTEVARFPLNGRTFSGFNDDTSSGRAIHPRGMAVDGDEILINVSNATEAITEEDFNEFPSGVWAYSERTGLYHKYSPSYQAVADTGVANLTDYGQHRTRAAGPLIVVESVPIGGDTTANNGGRILFAMEYFTDADTGGSDTEWGLFTDDTHDDTQKAGWITLPRVLSSKFRDYWRKVYAVISDLETSGDLVEVKYRTKDEEPTYATVTWTGTDRFSSNTDFTGYEEGAEVSIVQGKGSGVIAHARALTSGSGSEVILERDVPGVVVGQTSVVRLEKWKKIGKIEDISHEGFSTDENCKDHWIQVKLYLQWTGPRELHAILIDNEPSI